MDKKNKFISSPHNNTYKFIMKNILSFLAILLLLPYCAFSQTQEVQKIEFEARTGVTIPMGSFHGGKPDISLLFGMELRRNFKSSPWDCGVIMQLGGAEWHFYEKGEEGHYRQLNRSLYFSITGDYNFRQGKRVNPFAGLGIGTVGISVINYEYIPTYGPSLAFTPRVGVELMRHVRITCSANIIRKGVHTFDISLGFVIGGRPKKQKSE